MAEIDSSDNTPAAITGRSILVGAALSLLIAIGIPYGSMVIQGSRLGLSSATPAAFFLLFVLLLTIQLALGRWGFRRGELVVIFAMMAVATAIPTRGVVGMLLPMITGTFYYATPENQWADLVHPFLSDWMVVYDPAAVKAFYEGTKGSAIPYDVWLKPLGRWFAFYAAFYATIIAAISILRRQWVDNERLVFPLAQVPLAMIQDDDGEQKSLKPFFRNPIMWCGLLVPFLFNSTNALHHYFNFVPSLSLQTGVELFNRTASLNIRINFLMFGFAYFINSNIAFSLWFFYLLHVIQESIFSYIGIFSPRGVRALDRVWASRRDHGASDDGRTHRLGVLWAVDGAAPPQKCPAQGPAGRRPDRRLGGDPLLPGGVLALRRRRQRNGLLVVEERYPSLDCALLSVLVAGHIHRPSARHRRSGYAHRNAGNGPGRLCRLRRWRPGPRCARHGRHGLLLRLDRGLAGVYDRAPRQQPALGQCNQGHPPGRSFGPLSRPCSSASWSPAGSCSTSRTATVRSTCILSTSRVLPDTPRTLPRKSSPTPRGRASSGGCGRVSAL